MKGSLEKCFGRFEMVLIKKINKKMGGLLLKTIVEQLNQYIHSVESPVSNSTNG